MNEWPIETVAWTAGLFEGEGSAVVYNGRGEGYTPSPRVTIGMTDEWTIRRLHKLLGIGKVSTYQPREGNRKRVWRWTCASKREVPLLAALLPYLSPRRQSQLQSAIESCEPRPRKRRPPMPAETRRQLSFSKKGRKLSVEHRERIGNSLRGVPKTEEHRQNISNARKRRSTW